MKNDSALPKAASTAAESFPGRGEIGRFKPSIRPLVHWAREVAKLLYISERHLWQLTEDVVISCIRVRKGKRQTKVYLYEEIETWLTREATKGVTV